MVKKGIIAVLAISILAGGIYLIFLVVKEIDKGPPPLAPQKASTPTSIPSNKDTAALVTPNYIPKWQKVEDLKKKLNGAPQQADVLLELAQLYQKDGRFEAMQMYAERAVIAAKDNGEIVRTVAQLYEAERDYETALKHLQGARQIESSESKRQELKQKIAELISKKNDEHPGKLVATWEAELKSKDPVVRYRTVQQLARSKDDIAIEMLLQFIQQTKNEMEQTQAIRYLCQINTLSARSGIEKILADPTTSPMLKRKIEAALRMTSRKESESDKNQKK